MQLTDNNDALEYAARLINNMDITTDQLKFIMSKKGFNVDSQWIQQANLIAQAGSYKAHINSRDLMIPYSSL